MKTDYINQYSILHIQKPHYGMTSIRFLEDIKKIIIKNNLSSILDYGCGKSNLLDEIKKSLNVEIYKYDPAIPKYSKKVKSKIDFIICTDVLQHVPLWDLTRVLLELKNYNCKGFIHIRCTPYHTILPNGELANCTVFPCEWWENKLKEFFKKVDRYKTDYDTVSFIVE
jgi:hypothetical protein